MGWSAAAGCAGDGFARGDVALYAAASFVVAEGAGRGAARAAGRGAGTGDDEREPSNEPLVIGMPMRPRWADVRCDFLAQPAD